MAPPRDRTRSLMDLPSHPDANDEPPAQQPGATSRVTVVVVAVLVALVAVMVVLHLTGIVGPAD